jgi:hypothetical protein
MLTRVDEEVEVDFLSDDYGPGDIFVWEGDIISSPGFEDGTSSGRCVVLEDDTLDDNLYCTITWTFPEGIILLQGIFFELIVIGGTGCYEGIGNINALAIVQNGSDDSDDFTFDVSVQDPDSFSCSDAHFATPILEEVGEIFIGWASGEGDTTTLPGDSLVFDSNSIITADDLEGFLEGECMYHETVTNEEVFCTLTWGVGSGPISYISAQGPFQKMVVTGGTGCYEGISGTMGGRLGPLNSEGDVLNLEYDLSFDAEDSADDPSCSADIFLETWVTEIEDFASVDLLGDGPNAGDVNLYDNKPIVAPLPGGGEVVGLMAGRCIAYSDEIIELHCLYVIDFGDEGMIAFQGTFTEMFITAGSGCFRGVAGTVFGGTDGSDFTYDFSLE